MGVFIESLNVNRNQFIFWNDGGTPVLFPFQGSSALVKYYVLWDGAQLVCVYVSEPMSPIPLNLGTVTPGDIQEKVDQKVAAGEWLVLDELPLEYQPKKPKQSREAVALPTTLSLPAGIVAAPSSPEQLRRAAWAEQPYRPDSPLP